MQSGLTVLLTPSASISTMTIINVHIFLQNSSSFSNYKKFALVQLAILLQRGIIDFKEVQHHSMHKVQIFLAKISDSVPASAALYLITHKSFPNIPGPQWFILPPDHWRGNEDCRGTSGDRDAVGLVDFGGTRDNGGKVPQQISR